MISMSVSWQSRPGKGGNFRESPGTNGKMVFMEARVGIEPTNKGFTDLYLTTLSPF